jgi:hypothetical protein
MGKLEESLRAAETENKKLKDGLEVKIDEG